MLKPFAVLAAAVFTAAAFAQSTTTGTSSASQQVQLLGPQLVTFTGSPGNFESLVNGLSQGAPITLTTVGADGLVQIVTFVPGATQGAADIARNLEAARQNLISRGVVNPTAQQLAVALLGGTLTTVSGNNALSGVLTGTALPGAFQVRNELALPSTLNNGVLASTTTLQGLRDALAQGTLSPARGPLSAFDVNQTLQLASNVLAQQGILNPTPEQLRTALLGGTVTTPAGARVALQGLLPATTVRNTSDSPLFGTSDSPLFGTSDTGTLGTTRVTPTVSAPSPRSGAAPTPGGARGSASTGATGFSTTGAGRR